MDISCDEQHGAEMKRKERVCCHDKKRGGGKFDKASIEKRLGKVKV